MNTRIRKVELYSSGAYIEREGTITLKDGLSTQMVDFFSSSLDPSTVTILAPKNLNVTNIQCRLLTDEEKERINRDFAKEEKEILNNIENKTKEKELWDLNADFTGNTSAKIEEITNYIENLSKKKASIDKDIAELEEKLRKRRNDRKVSADYQSFYRIYADFNCSAGTYPIVIRYFENLSKWSQFYELHVDSDNNKAVIKAKALISQKTKEDWKDTEVVLLTGNPYKSMNIPELGVHRLNLVSENAKSKKNTSYEMGAGTMRAMMASADMAVAEEEMYEPAVSNAVINENDTSLEYALPGKHFISKDNVSILDIYAKEIECSFVDIAVPKLSSKAFLSIKTKTNNISELDGAVVSVYNNGVFCGKNRLVLDFDSEDEWISLGEDQSVVLKYETVKQFVSSAMLKSQKKKEFEFNLKVISNKSHDCDILLRASMPVSDNKEISVEAVELSKGKLDKETGLVTWEFNLPAGESKEFKLAYNVGWPKSEQINI